MRPILCAILLLLAVPAARAGESRVTLVVENMTCAACPITVKTAIGEVPGVEDVAVDLAARTVEVLFDDRLATVEQLEEASRLSGYPARRRE